MKRFVVSLALGMAAAGCGNSPATPTAAPVQSLLPETEQLAGWQAQGPTRLFPGAELYGHIDGGAEVFLELGFALLEVQEYRLDHDEVSLELYHMNDATAALGIYMMKCGKESPVAGLAYRHTATELQLQLVHRDLYLTVTSLSGGPRATQALTDVARAVVREMPAEPETPSCLALVPSSGQIPGSLRIIRGPFTLQGVYTLGEGDVLQLLATESTAVAADYGDSDDPWTLIVADYTEAEQARGVLNHATSRLDSYLEVEEQRENLLRFKDWQGRWGEIRLDGPRIKVRVNLTEPPASD